MSKGTIARMSLKYNLNAFSTNILRTGTEILCEVMMVLQHLWKELEESENKM